MTVAAPAAVATGADDGWRDQLAEPEAAVGDSLSVAVWTMVSRVTGLLRGVVVAAVLGATYFANTYQFTNALPNLVFYGFLAGSLFTSLLVPALVGHLDRGDLTAAGRVAGGLFGIVVALTAVVVPVAVVAAPLALQGGQARAAGLLVLMLMPQVPLYAVVGTATAVMNAQRRFALAAAAPALENLGIIAVLGAVTVRYPDAAASDDAPLGLLLLLGLGTTGSVALHAAVQWWGARRTGVTLWPRAGWRDLEVRALTRQAGTALVQAALSALQLVVLLALADRVVGGVVAFQLALNFYFLPIALAATPVALSLAPRLSRMLGEHDGPAFRDTYVRGLVYALFLIVPAAVAFLGLAGPLARAVSFGSFGSGGGSDLLAAALAGLSVGVAAEAVFMVSTYACYARGDTRTPLRAMGVQAAITLSVAMVGAATTSGVTTLTVLGAGLSAGGVCGAGLLAWTVLRRSAPGQARVLIPLARTIFCAALMVPPVRFVADVVAGQPVPLPAVSAVVAAAAAGVVVYFGAQGLLRAPEAGWVLGAVAGKLPRGVAGRWAPRCGVVGRRLLDLGRRRVDAAGVLRDLVGLGICLAVGALAAVAPVLAAVAVVALAAGVVLWQRPQLAAYLLIGVTPLTAGIDRGTLMPVLRPNEALLFGLVALLGLRWVVTARRGDFARFRLNGIEWALLVFATCSSFVPLFLMMVRNRDITGEDLNHAVVVWKLILVYGVVRFTITTTAQVMRALAVSLTAGAVVSLVAVLQALDLFGVPRLLAMFYSPFGVHTALAIGRGSSTLSLPAAVADLAIINLIISLALLTRRVGPRPLLAASAVVSAFGVVGAAEFSTFIGMVIALFAFILVTGQRRLLLQGAPVAVVGALVLEPVIVNRLSGFQSASGLPVSWIGRWRNLMTYFWPEVARDWNWVSGVRLQARVPSAAQEFGWIWIESGYLWLLWGGGLAFLFAYLALVLVSLRLSRRLVPARSAAVGVVATAVFCAVVANVFLMLLDPHITYRGAADALFGLLALTRVFPYLSPDLSPDPLPDEEESP